jgi:PAS domain S-box-containing protein
VIETLLANTTLLIAVSALFALLNRSRLLRQPWLHTAVVGLLFGGGAFAVMQAPIRLGDGMIFDARAVILTVAPVFGGPVAGVIAGAIAASGRLWIGGAGAAVGVLSIVIAVAAGTAYRLRIRRPLTEIPGWHFLALGIGVHAVTAFAFLLLPGDNAWRIFSEIGPVMTLVNGPGIWLLGFIMQVFESHRRQVLSISEERALLQVNLDRLGTVIESFPGAISVFSADQRLVVANDACYRMFGYPRDRFPTGAAMADMLRFAAENGAFGEVDVDRFVRGQIELARTAQSFSAERARADGTVIEERMQALATGGCLFMHQDITQRRRHEAGLQMRNAQLQAIREIESAFIRGGDKKQVFDSMLAVIQDLTGSEFGFVGEVLHDPDGNPYLKAWAISNIAWNPAMDELYRERLSRGLEFRRLDGLFGSIVTTGQPVISNDAVADPRAGGIPRGHPPLKAFLGMPIYSGDRLVGVAGVANRPGGYDSSLIDLLQPLAHACGMVISALTERAEREQAEAARKESATRLELAVQAGNIGIWIWEIETGRMYFSPEWKRQLGYEEHEIGDSQDEWISRLHPEDADATLAKLRRFLDAPWPDYTVEFRLRHKDGSYRWIISQGALLHGADGRPVRMMGTHVDVTGYKEAQQALTREASRRQLLFDNAPDGMCVLDADLTVIEANQSFARMLGLEMEELLGLGPWDWDVNWTTLEQLKTAFPDPPVTPITFFTRMRRKDGSIFDAEVTSVSADWAGRGAIFNVCRDVTDRVRADARLRELSTAVEQSPASIMITDTEGLIKYVNPRYEQVTGYRSEEVIGKVPRILRPGVLPAEELAGLKATIEAGGVWRGEYESVRRNGETFWETGSVSAIRTPDGRITNYILIHEDITRSKAIEAQLRQSQKMEAIGQLTAGMAHDFNNLLAIMVGNLELAVEATADRAVLDKVETALRAAQRGAALTRQLLAFGRRAPLMPQATELDVLVGELEPLLRRTLGEGIEVVTRLDRGVGPVMIDRNQMENAILNLAINARDAMPRGGTLTIEARAVTLEDMDDENIEPGAYAMVAVSDNGTGMTPDVLAHAFEPFFTTKAVGKGSGLGLSMVYGFVKQSGGYARILSEPEQGTSVRLYFPLSARTDSAARANGTETPAAGPAAGRGRILVLENDGDVRETISSQLRSLGYDVVTEQSGSTAIRRFEDGERIDLLLSDVMLGGAESGPEVVAEIRKRRPEIKVIYMSGYPRRAVVDRHGVADDVALLQKPIRRTDLACAIRKELGQ